MNARSIPQDALDLLAIGRRYYDMVGRDDTPAPSRPALCRANSE